MSNESIEKKSKMQKTMCNDNNIDTMSFKIDPTKIDLSQGYTSGSIESNDIPKLTCWSPSIQKKLQFSESSTLFQIIHPLEIDFYMNRIDDEIKFRREIQKYNGNEILIKKLKTYCKGRTLLVDRDRYNFEKNIHLDFSCIFEALFHATKSWSLQDPTKLSCISLNFFWPVTEY